MRRSDGQERSKLRYKCRNKHDLSEVEPESFQSTCSGSRNAGTPGLSFKALHIDLRLNFLPKNLYELIVISAFRMPMASPSV